VAAAGGWCRLGGLPLVASTLGQRSRYEALTTPDPP